MGWLWVFEQLQASLLDELRQAGRVNLERVSVDSFSLRAVKGDLTAANPPIGAMPVQAPCGRRGRWAAAVGDLERRSANTRPCWTRSWTASH